MLLKFISKLKNTATKALPNAIERHFWFLPVITETRPGGALTTFPMEKVVLLITAQNVERS